MAEHLPCNQAIGVRSSSRAQQKSSTNGSRRRRAALREALCPRILEQCFFGLWAGYGFAGTPLVREGSPPAAPLPDPIPDAVRAGPPIELPHREYLLYEGPVEAITATADFGHGQTANLAWPADHAWCLATEIDLAWTYVGGSESLVERLLADERIEALPAGADDPLTRIEPFVAELVEGGVEELFESGHTVITTSMGTVEASLERPTRSRPGPFGSDPSTSTVAEAVVEDRCTKARTFARRRRSFSPEPSPAW
jgi:hypothetical protein